MFDKIKAKSFYIFTFAFALSLLSVSTEQTYAVDSSHFLKIIFADDHAKSFTVPLSNNLTQTISQNKILGQDNFNRFNIIAYSIDNGPITQTSRDNGTFLLQIPTSMDHQIIFYSVLQHPIYITGTNDFKFLSSSPTRDNWFDVNSNVTILVPYIILSDQENVRQQLAGWSSDDSYINTITRNETGFYKLPNINVNAYHKIDFEYKKQYYINVKSDFGRPIGSGWYDENTIITISVIPGNDFILNRHFLGWEGSVIGQGGQGSANVLVTSPQTIVAMWQEDYMVISIIGIGIVSFITGVIIYYKRKIRS